MGEKSIIVPEVVLVPVPLPGWSDIWAKLPSFLTSTTLLLIAAFGLGMGSVKLIDHFKYPSGPIPPTISFEKAEIQVAPNEYAEVHVINNGRGVRWAYSDNLQQFSTALADPNISLFRSSRPGVYRVHATTATISFQLAWPPLVAVPSAPAHCKITVGVPVPPVPPVPPDPVPPIPPTPPAPIPSPGFRVLIVYDATKVMPAAQQEILMGAQVRQYLQAKCVKGVDGKTPDFRIWDQNVNMANEADLWKAAMQRKRGSVPWLLISNGTSGFEGPLPATAADTMKLLQQFGG